MQLKIEHKILDKLILPINYHHILQAIIYANMNAEVGMSDYFHNHGFEKEKRNFKLFTFGLLKGRYQIKGDKIIFYDQVSFEVRSPEILLLRTLAKNISEKGIVYGKQEFRNVKVKLQDRTVEEEELRIQMNSPICIYRTDEKTGKTYFYEPVEEEFEELLNANFRRKYEACYGVSPKAEIGIIPIRLEDKDKYVTRYKNFFITAWKGEYLLVGKRKYLDFLYQTGLGTKNSQGFGMFDIKCCKEEDENE